MIRPDSISNEKSQDGGRGVRWLVGRPEKSVRGPRDGGQGYASLQLDTRPCPT
jgi:hypothetical protein